MESKREREGKKGGKGSLPKRQSWGEKSSAPKGWWCGMGGGGNVDKGKKKKKHLTARKGSI